MASWPGFTDFHWKYARCLAGLGTLTLKTSGLIRTSSLRVWALLSSPLSLHGHCRYQAHALTVHGLFYLRVKTTPTERDKPAPAQEHENGGDASQLPMFYILINHEQTAGNGATLDEAREKGQPLCDAEMIPAVFSIYDEETFVEDIQRSDGRGLSEQVALFNEKHAPELAGVPTEALKAKVLDIAYFAKGIELLHGYQFLCARHRTTNVGIFVVAGNFGRAHFKKAIEEAAKAGLNTRRVIVYGETGTYSGNGIDFNKFDAIGVKLEPTAMPTQSAQALG